MRLLLDTHAFLWWILDDPRLSVRARRAIQKTGNQPLLSIVSVWECAIKIGKGSLQVPGASAQYIVDQAEISDVRLLDLRLAHIIALERLPRHHADPFDRMLAAQAREDGLPLLTNDSALSGYPIKTIW